MVLNIEMEEQVLLDQKIVIKVNNDKSNTSINYHQSVQGVLQYKKQK